MLSFIVKKYTSTQCNIRKFIAEQRGMVALEYVVLASIIVVALTTVGTNLQGVITQSFHSMQSKLITAGVDMSSGRPNQQRSQPQARQQAGGNQAGENQTQ